jgi:dCMP deaminase
MADLTWDEFFINMAILAATKSKDPSTKVGCIIVDDDNVQLSMGFNGFPRGIIETQQEWNSLNYINQLTKGLFEKITEPTNFDRWERPQKYSWVEHAERNAVYNAARKGISLKGARAYLNWDLAPCAECARSFIQSGIKEVIGPNIPFKGKGDGVHYHTSFAFKMFEESCVKMTPIDWKVDEKGLALLKGVQW